VATLPLGSRVVIGAQNKMTCSSSRVPRTTRTKFSPGLSRSGSSRSLDGERGEGLCYVSTSYTKRERRPGHSNFAEHLPSTSFGE
jgi:hypothetical protein